MFTEQVDFLLTHFGLEKSDETAKEWNRIELKIYVINFFSRFRERRKKISRETGSSRYRKECLMGAPWIITAQKAQVEQNINFISDWHLMFTRMAYIDVILSAERGEDIFVEVLQR